MYHRRQVRRASRANDESHRISQKSSFLPESTPVRNFSFDQIALHPPFSDVQPYGNTSPASGVERELSATELQTVRTISDETETILQQCAAIAQASSGPPQSGSLSDVERDVDLGSTPSPPQRR